MVERIRKEHINQADQAVSVIPVPGGKGRIFEVNFANGDGFVGWVEVVDPEARTAMVVTAKRVRRERGWKLPLGLIRYPAL